MRQRQASVVIIASALTLAACAARPVATKVAAPPSDRSAINGNEERLRALVAARQQTERDSEYVIAPGDLLVITIYNFRPGGGNFESEVRVDDRGDISVPFMDPLPAAGLSLAQLRAAFVRGLRESRVLNEPLVSVFLKEYQGQRVIILGAVARPGQYHLSRGQQTLVDVLSMAGGLSDRAGNYMLCRPSSPGQVAAAANDSIVQDYALHAASAVAPPARAPADMVVFRLDSAGGGTNPALLTLPVRGGDLFIVPEAGQAFIEGEIEKPGSYPLSRGMTLTQLITSAGGLAYPANRRRVTLIRQTGSGPSAEWALDVDRIREGEEGDVLLEPSDRVVVPATVGRKIAHGAYRTFTALVHFTVGGVASVF
ncbi:MAG: SLBB domain-containing protein [Deltaproteobacteria bacterium]|nr:SLBB domain-containing protein [Deltaproteobacteria bacterium]